MTTHHVRSDDQWKGALWRQTISSVVPCVECLHMLNTPLKFFAILALVIVVGGGVAWYVLWQMHGAPYLVGEREHDFGRQPITMPWVRFEHTFTLENTSQETLNVTGVKATCGCTTAELVDRTIEPGEVMEIIGQIRVERSRSRYSKIYVTLASGDIVGLKLSVEGRKSQPLRSYPTLLHLPGGIKRSKATLQWEVFDTVLPPAPTITWPAGVEGSFDRWSLFNKARGDKGEPNQYTGELKVHLTGGDLQPGSVIIVQLPPAGRLEIPITTTDQLTDEIPEEPTTGTVVTSTELDGET